MKALGPKSMLLKFQAIDSNVSGIFINFFMVLRLVSLFLVSVLFSFWLVIFYKQYFLGMVIIWFFIHPLSSFKWHEDMLNHTMCYVISM